VASAVSIPSSPLLKKARLAEQDIRESKGLLQIMIVFTTWWDGSLGNRITMNRFRRLYSESMYSRLTEPSSWTNNAIALINKLEPCPKMGEEVFNSLKSMYLT
jgi:hypothetical protein